MQKELTLATGVKVIITNDFKHLEEKDGAAGYDWSLADRQYDNFGYYILDKEFMDVVDNAFIISDVVEAEGRWE